MRFLLVLALPLALGACAATSQAPLFASQDVARHPLAEGLWALSGPGCDVGPLPAGKPLPECALGLFFVGDHMTVDLENLPPVLKDGPAGLAGGPFDFSKGTTKTDVASTLLAGGDPMVLQVQSTQGDTQAQGQAVSYYSLRPLASDGSGRIVRAVIWPVACPVKGQDTVGFKLAGAGCTVESAEAVRRQAPHLAPFFSFFLTWVRAQLPPAPKPAG